MTTFTSTFTLPTLPSDEELEVIFAKAAERQKVLDADPNVITMKDLDNAELDKRSDEMAALFAQVDAIMAKDIYK